MCIVCSFLRLNFRVRFIFFVPPSSSPPSVLASILLSLPQLLPPASFSSSAPILRFPFLLAIQFLRFRCTFLKVIILVSSQACPIIIAYHYRSVNPFLLFFLIFFIFVCNMQKNQDLYIFLDNLHRIYRKKQNKK